MGKKHVLELKNEELESLKHIVLNKIHNLSITNINEDLIIEPCEYIDKKVIKKINAIKFNTKIFPELKFSFDEKEIKKIKDLFHP